MGVPQCVLANTRTKRGRTHPFPKLVQGKELFMTRDEIWVCSACGGLEFALEDQNIEVVYKGCRSAVILFEGRAHSLVCTTLEKAKRRRTIEQRALTVGPHTMGDNKQYPSEETVLGDPK